MTDKILKLPTGKIRFFFIAKNIFQLQPNLQTLQPAVRQNKSKYQIN